MSATSNAANANLGNARRGKNDEFYTQLVDIERELRHYGGHFRGKVVLCNCDDPYESNFFRFLTMNFRRLGIKKLIASSYAGSPVQGEQLSLFGLEGLTEADAVARRPYKIEITEIPDANGDGAIDLSDVEHLLAHDANVLTALKGDGDFRSRECLGLLDEADIVVTNPPFSLFREYLATLMARDKKFLILGDQNALTYKEVFPLIKSNSLWLGNDNGGTKWFRVPDDYNIATESRKKIVGGIQYFSMGRIVWFTNLDHAKRHESMILTEQYNAVRYPAYDNYPAIEIPRVADIPEDWTGAMGVPITFLEKYNPEQFEILGNDDGDFPATRTYGSKKKVVDSVPGRSNTGALRCVIRTDTFGPGTYFDVGYPVRGVYRRIFIRRIGGTH